VGPSFPPRPPDDLASPTPRASTAFITACDGGGSVTDAAQHVRGRGQPPDPSPLSDYNSFMNARSTPNGSRTPWGWYILLVLPFIGILWVSSYDSADPALFGIPFFYWYQFLWIFISA